MSDNANSLENLGAHFKAESNELISLGIDTWSSIKSLKDSDISRIARKSLATARNLKTLRCMACLICDMNISHGEAALLIHAGVPTIEAIARLTPNELINKAGRLERQLQTNRSLPINLEKAHAWIKRAKDRQILN